MTGNYTEDANKDPVDYYGYLKALGEHNDINLVTLRCSLLGRELNSKVQFLEFVLNHNKGSVINGFTDHLWNGLTTLHLAKIINGVIQSNIFNAGTFHLVPSDIVSKFELARVIIEYFGKSDVRITQSQGYRPVNRVLKTNFQEFNNNMWGNAGYSGPQSISQMVKEYALWV